jgi:hypothetical protein
MNSLNSYQRKRDSHMWQDDVQAPINVFFFQGQDWSYETELPAWAKPDWTEPVHSDDDDNADEASEASAAAAVPGNASQPAVETTVAKE